MVHVGGGGAGTRSSTSTSSGVVSGVGGLRTTARRRGSAVGAPATGAAGVRTAVEPGEVLVGQVEELRPRGAHEAQVRLQPGHHQGGVLGGHGVVQHGVACAV